LASSRALLGGPIRWFARLREAGGSLKGKMVIRRTETPIEGPERDESVE